ncbi:PadR family transcriptional regulator [Halococcus agarilyticus]|uniref:PadR family transcriptional regulator n=1 Tax=Halococcus agarilyticus TaxID=1232219 RepID=UPI000677EADC|nr:helix-turn-helix transcriptional regulator [Halococcus agarilyticus]
MEDLTAFQRDLLYVIAGMDEPKGLGVSEELQRAYDGDINHGRLYPNLDTLVENGLVEKGAQSDVTNFYTVTERGEAAIAARHAWERQYVDHPADD